MINPIVTIIEEIKKDLNLSDEEEIIYNVTPIPFKRDDFVFMKSSTTDADEYMDELFQFSLLANQIPDRGTTSINSTSQRLFYEELEEVLKYSELADGDSISTENLFASSLVENLLDEINDAESVAVYRELLGLISSLEVKVKQLEDELKDQTNSTIISLTEDQIKLINEKLDQIKAKYKEKEEIKEIDGIVERFLKGDIKKFKDRWTDIKDRLEIGGLLTHPKNNMLFANTTCTEEALFSGKKLPVKTMTIEGDRAKQIFESKKEDYPDLFFDLNDDFSERDLQSVKFSYMVVNIVRSWFSPNIDFDELKKPYWRSSELNQKSLDLIPEKLIFFKDLTIQYKAKPEKPVTKTLKVVGNQKTTVFKVNTLKVPLQTFKLKASAAVNKNVARSNMSKNINLANNLSSANIIQPSLKIAKVYQFDNKRVMINNFSAADKSDYIKKMVADKSSVELEGLIKKEKHIKLFTLSFMNSRKQLIAPQSVRIIDKYTNRLIASKTRGGKVLIRKRLKPRWKYIVIAKFKDYSDINKVFNVEKNSKNTHTISIVSKKAEKVVNEPVEFKDTSYLRLLGIIYKKLKRDESIMKDLNFE